MILPARNETGGPIPMGDISCGVPQRVVQGDAGRKIHTHSNVAPQNLSSKTITKHSTIPSKPTFHFSLFVVGTGAVCGFFSLLLSLLTHR